MFCAIRGVLRDPRFIAVGFTFKGAPLCMLFGLATVRIRPDLVAWSICSRLIVALKDLVGCFCSLDEFY